MTTTFILDESFLKKFKNKQPAWGPVGYLTYKRTYARRLPDGKYEEFWQTLKRVVEGVYTIQYEHCQSLKLPWSFSKAQRSAQEMFTRMWQFKFLPPGRGLWMMGTDHVNKVGSACLNNCAFVSTADLKTSFSAPFCFLMDMSMLGVGVGGDTKGAGTLTIKKPFLDETTHVIPDTREGWVEAVRRVLDAYVREATLPAQFDFAQIRPAGTAINGFGGTASGSGPLEELLKTIPSLLQPLVGKKITSTVIVDLFNVIGRCVVSGNVRRSAEIMFGALTDKDFLLLKDPELHAAELEHHRWASNNSVVVTPGDDYTAAAERTARNGEPGYLWLDNARKYSRMNGVIDNKDEAAEGSNPCQPAWATVLTPEGIRTFADIDVGSTIWSGKQWTKITKKWLTGTKPVYRYQTTSGVFYGTETHNVISNGVRTHAKDAVTIDSCNGNLIAGDSFNLQTVVDGLVLGDGTVKHMTGRNYTYTMLCIGENDSSYFDSEIKDFIGDLFDTRMYNVMTTVDDFELPLTYNRKIPDRFLTGNEMTMRSFLRGLYTANGSIVDSRVTLKTASPYIRDGVQLMLSALGVKSYFTTNKATNVKFENGEYLCKESYDVNISTDRELFYKFIGFIQPYKQTKLKEICASTAKAGKPAKTSFEVKQVKFIEECPVFDITVDAEEHTYWTGGLLVSNCVEQTLESFELCCLVESFPANHDSIEDYKRTLKYSYLYAKTVTLVPTHDKRTNAVMLRNRRIGLSQSGIVQAVHKIGRRKYFNWCEQGYTYVCALDKQYSRWMCVPESIKKTSVKPSGSVSLLPGATPGVHHPESEYHIRNVRCEENSPIVKAYREANYVCEKDVYTPNTTVVSVPVHEKYFTRGKADVSMWEQLEIVAQIQQHWADNQVSATITFNKNEAKDIKHALELYETRLKGISFLPLTDHGYKQAPYIPITKEQYEEMVARIKSVDLSLITHDVTDSYCDGDKCVIPLAKVA